jgi:drug/metabolite transporter (DMT)-like permease
MDSGYGKWYVVLVVTMFLWATFFPGSKHLSETISPLTLSFLRYFFAVIALVPFSLARRVERADVSRLVGLGALGIAGFTFLLYSGLARSTASSSSIIVNSQAIFVAFLSPWLIKEHFTKRRIAGALVGVAGLVLVITNGESLGSIVSEEYFIGDMLLICAALAMGIYSIYMKGYVSKYGSTTATFYTMVFGLAILTLALVGYGAAPELGDLTAPQWAIAAYIGVVPTALVYIVFNYSLRIVGVVNATAFKLLMPIFAVMLSIALLSEEATVAMLVGLALVIGGIFTIQSTRH